jgi:PEP-CTERM motif
MTRTSKLLLRVLVLGISLSFSFGANALPLSPKWMKSSIEGKKVNETPGELDNGNGGGGGIGPQALPDPATLWLFAIGAVGMTFVRRKQIR